MEFRTPSWHLLQISDVLDIEFATALAESVPVIAWEPERSWFPWLQQSKVQAPGRAIDLRVVRFPLLRGYARLPLSLIAGTGSSVSARLREQTPESKYSPLVCSTPYFAGVAERWEGPVVYWLTDLIAAYGSARSVDVRKLDVRMCRAATLVCPNSERLRRYLIDEAQCDPSKIHIVPNATRATNVLTAMPKGAGELPAELRKMERPIAGVIGNLAGNMDWVLLEGVIERTPYLSWVFVGPTTMAIPDARQRRAREAVVSHERTLFVGKQPYGRLADFAQSFDVAVLPYLRCEPTYSGSSTRFYEHLVACRPMVATRGLEELLRKVPLLRLVDTVDQMSDALDDLQAVRFDDGLTEMRWRASQQATWQARAHSMQEALAERWPVLRRTMSNDAVCA